MSRYVSCGVTKIQLGVFNYEFEGVTLPLDPTKTSASSRFRLNLE